MPFSHGENKALYLWLGDGCGDGGGIPSFGVSSPFDLDERIANCKSGS